MALAEIKAKIEQLPEDEKHELYTWFTASREDAWDREIERDFSAGGRGEFMLRQINAEVDALLASNEPLTPITEELRRRRVK